MIFQDFVNKNVLITTEAIVAPVIVAMNWVPTIELALMSMNVNCNTTIVYVWVTAIMCQALMSALVHVAMLWILIDIHAVISMNVLPVNTARAGMMFVLTLAAVINVLPFFVL